ncbi:hypothetical protein SNE40_007425 [Patella caerulea]|uniref:B30.2/SPRY domain-containing protein n=1 Tax=Patella caerulea TaxID=87958 RepID=A0AAN8JXN6_PATCE
MEHSEPMISDENTNQSQDSEMNETDSEATCYCDKPRLVGSAEIQCTLCLRWFHVNCVDGVNGVCLPFITNYQFCCKTCSPTAIDKFQRKQASFSQICLTALANLTHDALSRGETKAVFSKDKDIIPFIDKNWEGITILSRRTKSTWHNTVLKTLHKENDLFQSDESGENFSLLNPDLSKIAPNYENLRNASSGLGLSDTTKSRSAKRKAPFDNIPFSGMKQKKNEIGLSNKLMAHGYPLEHPFNKDGYRYILAESDPHAPNRQAFDDSQEWAGKPIPGYLYRTCLANHVLLALHDRAPQLKVSDDRLSVTGDKGYSMLRASHGVRYGGWYFEATIEEMPPDGATRIGWSQSLGNLQAPCGYDKFSYSWRSRKGTVFHQSRGKHYGDGFEEGDVVGFYIYLPTPKKPSKLLPTTYKDRPLVKFKSHLYYEDKDNVSESEKSLKPCIGSKIMFFKNGKNQGVAFEDIYEGIYYPAFSLYKTTTVTLNCGPDFKFPPKGLESFRPMSDAAIQSIVDGCLADIVYHVENEGKLPEF